MSTKPVVLFPVFDDNTEDIEFRKHTVSLANVIGQAIHTYLDNADDDISATSIGAACFVVAHMVSHSFNDKRKNQVTQGLVAMLALNNPSAMLELATIPPTDMKLN